MRQLRIIFLFFLPIIIDGCRNPTKDTHQLNERITRLEQRLDSLTHTTNTDSGGINNMGTIWQTNRCAAITKKGTPCRRKPKSNGYCWQHGG